MSIPLFCHSANAAVDRPLCHKSREQVIQMLREGTIQILRNSKGKEWAVQFKPVLEHTLAAQLAAYLASSPDLRSGETAEELLDLFKGSSDQSTASISDGEMRANVGECENEMEIIRARTKIKHWPICGDDKAVRIGCRA